MFDVKLNFAFTSLRITRTNSHACVFTCINNAFVYIFMHRYRNLYLTPNEISHLLCRINESVLLFAINISMLLTRKTMRYARRRINCLFLFFFIEGNFTKVDVAKKPSCNFVLLFDEVNLLINNTIIILLIDFEIIRNYHNYFASEREN